jgi:hypothetical protein
MDRGDGCSLAERDLAVFVNAARQPAASGNPSLRALAHAVALAFGTIAVSLALQLK